MSGDILREIIEGISGGFPAGMCWNGAINRFKNAIAGKSYHLPGRLESVGESLGGSIEKSFEESLKQNLEKLLKK